MIIYGIKNCDTIKKARKFLESRGVDYQFHDFKKDGVNELMLRRWMENSCWEPLVNKRGTTWRKLPEGERNAINNDSSAIKALLANSSMIKRPVLEHNGKITIGFDLDEYNSLLNIK